MARTNQRNYYRLLHVQFDAPVEVIQASYRAIMQKLKQHPDLGGDEANASLLNAAYSVLINPEKRAKYDKKYLQKNPSSRGRGFNSRQSSQKSSVFKKTSTSKSNGAAKYGSMAPVHCPFCGASISDHGLHGARIIACRVCDSPLTPVKKSGHTGSCKRALKRTSVKGLVHFLTRWPQFKEKVGEIQNLSPMGLKFTYCHEIPLSSFIKVDSRGLKAVARVVSCLPSAEKQVTGFCIGVEFITLSYRAAQGVFVSEKV